MLTQSLSSRQRGWHLEEVYQKPFYVPTELTLSHKAGWYWDRAIKEPSDKL